MQAFNWCGVVTAIVGLVFLFDVRGSARNVAELSRWLSEDRGAGPFALNLPKTAWGMRMVGAALVVLGVCFAVFPAPS